MLGAYWSKQQVMTLLAPSDKAVGAVTSFLAQHGASADVQGELITTSMSVTQAEAAFGTKFAKFSHGKVETAFIHRASQGYSLPRDVAEVVSTVDGILNMPRISTPEVTKASGKSPSRCPPSLSISLCLP